MNEQESETITNDVTIQVATVNGSGSQSANIILTRSIFRMGIPVGPKNMFPSNIQGLPTWYTVRINGDGYLARKRTLDFLVAFNPATWAEDVRQIAPGGAIVYHDRFDPSALEGLDDSIALYPVPFTELADREIPQARLRKLLTNLIYVGVLTDLLEIEVPTVEDAISRFFQSKPKAVSANLHALHVGIDYAREHLQKRDPFRLERMNGTDGQILIEGNTACALGSVQAGCHFVGWYPITPSSSLCEKTIEFMKRYRTDPETGESRFAAVQAEDEIAAIGMVLGATWAGARAMTATSGPGISLMGEMAGLAYYAELPAVIFDVQRVGPSTGLPTRTAQGDIAQVASLSHGDTSHVMLFPASPRECFELTQQAFDLAERLQAPIFVMTDLDLGMNLWPSEPFSVDDRPADRGKVLTAEDLEAGVEFRRYADVDGDAIPYRTLPGNRDSRSAFFTRGSGHNEEARYTEDHEVYKRVIDRIRRKFDTARELIPGPEIDRVSGAKIGLIAFGSTDMAMREARDRLLAEGVEVSYLRLRSYPLHEDVAAFVAEHERVYVVEQNRDGQMHQLLAADLDADFARRIGSIRVYSGLPIDARSIVEGLLAEERTEGKEVVHAC